MINRLTLLFSHSKESIYLIFCWKLFCLVFIWSCCVYVTVLQIYTVLIKTSKLQLFVKMRKFWVAMIQFLFLQIFQEWELQIWQFPKGQIRQDINFRRNLNFRIGYLKSTVQNWDAVRFLWKNDHLYPRQKLLKSDKNSNYSVLWKIARLQRRPTNYLVV